MATVKVGCKIPNGIICAMGNQKVTINGANSSALVNGFGITDVDKEFFDAWLERHKDLKMVKRGLVFAVDHAAKMDGATKEKQSEKTGLERLDPEKPVKGAKKDSGE